MCPIPQTDRIYQYMQTMNKNQFIRPSASPGMTQERTTRLIPNPTASLADHLGESLSEAPLSGLSAKNITGVSQLKCIDKGTNVEMCTGPHANPTMIVDANPNSKSKCSIRKDHLDKLRMLCVNKRKHHIDTRHSGNITKDKFSSRRLTKCSLTKHYWPIIGASPITESRAPSVYETSVLASMNKIPTLGKGSQVSPSTHCPISLSLTNTLAVPDCTGGKIGHSTQISTPSNHQLWETPPTVNDKINYHTIKQYHIPAPLYCLEKLMTRTTGTMTLEDSNKLNY